MDRLKKRKRRDDICAVDLFENIQRVVEQLRLRARPQDAGIIYYRVQATSRPRSVGERLAMRRVGDIAGDGGDLRVLRECGACVGERVGTARIDDQIPVAAG